MFSDLILTIELSQLGFVSQTLGRVSLYRCFMPCGSDPVHSVRLYYLSNSKLELLFLNLPLNIASPETGHCNHRGLGRDMERGYNGELVQPMKERVSLIHIAS